MVSKTNASSRGSGLEGPRHPLHILSWVLFPLFASVYFAVFLPTIKDEKYGAKWTLGVTYAALCIDSLYHAYKATATNPKDDHSGSAEASADEGIAPFNEFVFCHICQQYVKSTSKHCRLCNKCVAGFDHHCHWLNNCVGEKNYNYFFTALCSVTGLVLLQLGVCTWCLVELTSRDAHKKGPNQQLPRFIFTAIFIVLLVGVLGLLVHLLCFHLMLIKRQTTTYDYLVKKAREKRERKHEEMNRKIELKNTRRKSAEEKKKKTKGAAVKQDSSSSHVRLGDLELAQV